jgi:hypothetical protein
MSSGTIDGVEDLGTGKGASAALWSSEIKASQTFLEKFHRSATKINRRYLDKRDAGQQSEFRVNLFWSTIQVVMSLLYAQPPKADVKRLYDDYSDQPSRVASEILERILNNDLQSDHGSSSASIRYAIQDWVTIGLGQIWARYDLQTAVDDAPPGIDPMTGEPIEAEPVERIVSEDALIEYVHWQDFLYSPARIWEEVRWVARRAYLTKEKLISRFGEEVAGKVPMTGNQTKDPKEAQDKPKDPWNRAEVWEIWDKRTKKVYWFSPGCDFLLDEREDPLGLSAFFPCPPALFANASTTELIPRSDYIMSQDQFEQLDEINTRVTWLTRAMKVVGVYDKSAEGVQRMLSQGVENQLIPVDNWAMFAESGGLKQKVDWMPVSEVASVIERLVNLREQVKAQIYEVLGISDIMRGSTKASETAAAQQIKAQFGSTRIQLKQFYIAKFVQAGMSIKAEIIERHFQPETIAKMSNIMATPDAEFAQEAIRLLKTPDESQYRVLIQADTLAYIDRKAENDVRTAALTAIGQFIQQVMGLTDKLPGAAPYMLEIVRWYGAGFKGFQEIEGIMNRAIDAATKMQQEPAKPDQMYEAEVAEKQAGALERRANAVQKLADAGLKTAQSAMPFPAPPEQFLNGMQGQQQAMAQQPTREQMMASQSPPQPMPSMGTEPNAGVPHDVTQMGEPNMPPMMPSMPPLIPGAGQ